jgi:hypothetical protein
MAENMNLNSNTFNISNEQLLLVNILNGMYNDNSRQIQSLTNSINSLMDGNRHIQNIISQMLNIPTSRNNNSRNNIENVNNRRNASISSSRSRTENTNFSRLIQSFLQPVEIFPTSTQIENATRRVRYSEILTPLNRTCPISLENFCDNDNVTIIRFCRHIFNTEHLNTWFRTNTRCPVCRYDIRNYNSNVSTDIFRNGQERETEETQERTNINQSIGRPIRNVSSTILDTYVNNILNENNSSNNSDTQGLTSVSYDISGNLSDPLIIIRLLTELNNNSNYP